MKRLQLCAIYGILLTTTLLATASYGHEDAFQVRYRFRHITIEDGLSQSSVNCLMQDRAGFMWIGTQDGLNRYDGRDIRIWKSDAEDVNTMSDSYITCMEETDNGTIWVGTEASGFGRFDRDTWSFDFICQGPPREADEPTSTYEVLDLVIGPLGGIWVATVSHGLLRYNPESQAMTTWQVCDGMPANEITSLLFDGTGQLWIGTAAGLSRFGAAGESPESVLAVGGAESDDTSRRINTVFRAHDGVIWLGTDAGLARYDAASDRWRHVLPAVDGVLAMDEDQNGHLWLGVDGVVRYDPETDQSMKIKPDLTNPTSLQTDNIQTLCVDESGVVWVGHELGASLLDTHAKLFYYYNHVVGDPNSLSHNTVWSLLEDSRGMVWVATSDGLCRFDPRIGDFEVLHADPTSDRHPSSDINTMVYEDSRGFIWVGYAHGALDVFDPDTGRFRHFVQDLTGRSGPPNLRVYDADEGPDGRLWMATYAGLQSYDLETDTFRADYRETGSVFDIGGLACKTIDVLPDGTIWLGTWGGGLVHIDPKAGERTVFRHDRGDRQTLSSDTILSLMVDRQGRVWAGTGTGLNRLDPTTGLLTRLTEKTGLPNNTIYALSQDRDDNIWASSTFGLFRLHPETLALEHFQARDGCQSNEFNMGAASYGTSGRMYFGGINGFNVFYPEQIEANHYLPPVYVTDFKINNQRVDTGELNRGRELLTKPIYQTGRIELDHQDHVVSFAFSALHFAVPEKIRYQYMLDGFDPDWIDAGNRNHATYTNLPAGRYVFRVRGSNSDGVWNEAGTGLAIVMRPPFWETPWFLAAMGLLVISAVNGFIRYRMRLMKVRTHDLEKRVARRTSDLTRANHFLQQEITERRRVEEALRAARNEAIEATRTKSEFLANMSHEIRTPMNGVLGMTSVLLSGDLTAEMREHLELVYGSARNLLGIINDILDFSKVEAGKLELESIDFDPRALVEEVGELLGPRAGDKGLLFNLRIDHDVPLALRGDPVRIRQILVNLLNNAIKFTDQGRVTVSVETVGPRDDHTIRVEVRDTGLGIPVDRMSCLFQSFSQVDTSTTRQYGGTGLGLAICKQLVGLMEGEIGVESEIGEGTTFWFEVTFPKAAELPEVPPQLPGRVLVVMPDPDVQRAAVEVLRYLGADPVTVDPGPDLAYETLLALTQCPDCIAVLTGSWSQNPESRAVPRKLQAALGAAAPPCVTTFCLSEVVAGEELARHGFSAWVTCPLRGAKVYDALRQAIDRREFEATRSIPVPAISVAEPSVAPAVELPVADTDDRPLLLAEDNPVNQKVAVILLRKLGYDVEVVDNGAEAVAALARRRFRLVFMDVQMPVMDGYEAVRRIRLGDAGVLEPDVPIIALTAHAMKGDRQRCIDAGMDDYLAKPIDHSELVVLLGKYLKVAEPVES